MVMVACGNCVRYGAECPGYDKKRKFVDGKHVVRARRAMSTQATTGPHDTQVDFLFPSDSDSDPAVPATQTFTPLTNQSALKRWAPNFSHYGGQVQTIPGALKEPCIPFVYNMMGQLFTIHSREEVFFTSPWFSTMLNYLGTTPVLDSAMCAFMLQLVGKAKRDAADVNRSRDIYGQSLGALQRALNHSVGWKSTETLAATILCSLFEVSEWLTCRPTKVPLVTTLPSFFLFVLSYQTCWLVGHQVYDPLPFRQSVESSSFHEATTWC